LNIDDLMARAAILQTIAAYTRAGDTGRVEDLVACFAPDGVLETAGRVSRGPDQIRAFVSEVGEMFAADSAFLPARHHVASVWIELERKDRARAGAYFTLVAANGVDHWGTYRDGLVRVAGRWCFARRRVRIEGAREGSPVATMVE
jgi:hypothetical protein